MYVGKEQDVAWQAKWIWVDGHTDTRNFYMYARREVDLASADHARVFVTASAEYVLYVNGKLIGRGPDPCHPSFQYYDEYDLTDNVRQGINVIAAICYNYGVATNCRPKLTGGFLLQMEVSNDNADPFVITTDETWKVKPADDWDFSSTQLHGATGFQEVYDLRKRPSGWNEAGFDDSSWQDACVLGLVGTSPWVHMVAKQIPHLRKYEIAAECVLDLGEIERISNPELDVASQMYAEQVKPDSNTVVHPEEVISLSTGRATVLPGKDKFIVLDFGREVVGYPRIKAACDGSPSVDIGYCERLDDNGRVFTTRQGILHADRLFFARGKQEWRAFNRRAFRYMQLTFRDIANPLSVESVSLERVGYPVEQVSSFDCSDHLLNEIWRTGVYTLSVCMQEVFEDCPLREHAQYAGDSRIQALMNYYSFFDTQLASKALWQFVQCQRDDGLFTGHWPGHGICTFPDYCLVWVTMLHDYCLYTGDESLVRRLYPSARRLLEEWIKNQEDENGLLTWHDDPTAPPGSWWLFIDHAPLDKRGEVATYNAFYYRSLLDATDIAEFLGHSEDASIWRNRAERLRRAFNSRFWSECRGVYVDCVVDGVPSDVASIQTNTLAVAFGLADPTQCSKIRNFLLSDALRVRSSGPYFDFYVLQAMVRLGMVSEALDMIRSKWGRMLKNGATTWWELIDESLPEDKVPECSLCHAWSGAPTYFLPAEILGVRPLAVGSDVIVVHPSFGDLLWAKGSVKTRQEMVKLEWRREQSGFQLDLRCQCDLLIGLPIPDNGDSVVYESEVDLTGLPGKPKAIWRGGGDGSKSERYPGLSWALRKGAPNIVVEGNYVWVRRHPATGLRYTVENGPEAMR